VKESRIRELKNLNLQRKKKDWAGNVSFATIDTQ
jgi:hypothetical protein